MLDVVGVQLVAVGESQKKEGLGRGGRRGDEEEGGGRLRGESGQVGVQLQRAERRHDQRRFRSRSNSERYVLEGCRGCRCVFDPTGPRLPATGRQVRQPGT